MKKIFTLLFICTIALSSYAQDLGELNPTFGNDGSITFDPSVKHDKMEKILVQKDGKIITVGGARVGGSNYSIYVSRHNANGTLDETYGESGIAYFKANPLIYMNYAFDAVLNDDDMLFITGYTFDYTDNSAFVLCLDEHGMENPEFGENGYVVSEYGGGIVYDAIKLDTKGRPVVAGYYNDNILIRRYNTKGKIDKTFGEDGTVIIKLDPSPNAWSYAYDIEILENGKMLLTGHKVSDGMDYVAYLMRLKSNGTLDETFADKGILYLNANTHEKYPEYAVSVCVQTDGKYVVAGHADLPPGESNLVRSEAYITRINTDGSIDESFGTNGFVRFEPFEGDGCTNTTATILSTRDNQIFGTLYSYNALTQASRAYVYNLDADGNHKEDFAGSGIMALPKIEDEVAITTKSMALQDNKNLLVGGYIALDNSSTVKTFISCVNIDIKEETPENPDENIEELTSSLLLYPNPVNDRLYIETEVEVEEVVVYTITGVVVGQQTTVNGQQTSSIDVSNLKNGVYFVKVVTENGEAVKRIIKN